MSEKKSKGIFKRVLRSVLFIAIGIAVGFICAFVFMEFIDLKSFLPQGAPAWASFVFTASVMLAFSVAYIIQIIIHEGGHLLFGLMTGYKFCSFRIGSVILLKQNGRYSVKRFSLAGTGGQCLMAPPDMKDGKMPVMLYNLGGCLLNLITALAFGGLGLLFKDIAYLSAFCTMLFLAGLLTGFTNGVPLKTATVANDGYNAFSLGKDKKAMAAFWLQLKINEMQTNGVRLEDMPEEWFVFPEKEDLGNSMMAATAVVCCSRLVAERRFEEAENAMAELMNEKGVVPLYKMLMTCDRLYIEAVGQNRPEIISGFYTKQQQGQMSVMKNYPSVLRTEYVYALLCAGDEKKAGQIKEKYSALYKSYPYLNDLESEKELMTLAEQKRGEQNEQI